MIKEGHCNIWNIDDRFYQLKYYLDGVKRYPHNEITPEESILLQEIEETIPSNRGLSKWLSNKMGFLDMERAAMDNEFLRILKTCIRPMLETSKLVLKLKTKLDEMEERYGSFFDYISHVSNDKEIKNGKP